jgi:hypothetical protein
MHNACMVAECPMPKKHDFIEKVIFNNAIIKRK